MVKTNIAGTEDYGYYSTYGGNWTEDAGPCTITCSGAIRATFTYHELSENDPPPRKLLLYQSLEATYGGTGSCSTGLTPEVTSGKSKTAIKYSIVDNPGWLFTRTVSPSASSTTLVSGGTAEPAHTTIKYTTLSYPINLSYNGLVKVEESYATIIGKRIVAGIGLGGNSVSEPEFALVPTWSVAGDKFSYYAVASNSSSGHRVNVPISEWSETAPQWIWNNDGSETISCHVSIRKNGFEVATTDFTDDVAVFEPDYFCAANAAHENVYGMVGLSTVVYSNGNPSVVLEDERRGIIYHGKVHKQTRFSSYGVGKYDWCQLVNAYRFTGTHVISTNGEDWLDNSFPYEPGGSDNDAEITSQADSPNQNVISNFSIHDYYDMYMIYVPSPLPQSADYVPLHVIFWDWTASGPLSTEGNPNLGTTVLSNFRTTAHPDWSHLFSNIGGGSGSGGGGAN